jgi:hypothetical protein
MCFSCPLYYLSQLHQVNHDGKFGMSTELNGLNNRHLVGLYAWHATLSHISHIMKFHLLGIGFSTSG